MFINKEKLKKNGSIAFVLAIVVATFYYFAQVMGWIPNSSTDDVKEKTEVKKVEVQVKNYK